jgi:hypothetical protein
MVRKKVETDKKQGFYSKVLDEAEKISLEEARNIEGLDEEIAMLRVRAKSVFRHSQTLNFFVDPSEGHDDYLMSLALVIQAAKGYLPRKAIGH